MLAVGGEAKVGPASIKEQRLLVRIADANAARGRKFGWKEDEVPLPRIGGDVHVQTLLMNVLRQASAYLSITEQQRLSGVSHFYHSPLLSMIASLPSGYHGACSMFGRDGSLKLAEMMDQNLCLLLRTDDSTVNIYVRVEGVEEIIPGTRDLANYEQVTLYTGEEDDSFCLYMKLMHQSKGHELLIKFLDGTLGVVKQLRPDSDNPMINRAPWKSSDLQGMYNAECARLRVSPLCICSSSDMPGGYLYLQ
jgi:hypothetical protein